MGGDIVTEETQLFLIQNVRAVSRRGREAAATGVLMATSLQQPGGGGQSIPPPGLNQRMEGVDPFLGVSCVPLQVFESRRDLR